jgi:hypothetical protein
MQHRSKQRGLVFDAARFTQSRDQRLCFGKCDGRLKDALRFFDDLSCDLTGISESNVTGIKILRTETSRFTQRCTDDAAADIRRASICRCELMARKVSRRARQIGSESD